MIAVAFWRATLSELSPVENFRRLPLCITLTV